VFEDYGQTSYDTSACGIIADIRSGNGVTSIRNVENTVYLLGKFMKKNYGLDAPIGDEFLSVTFGAEHCLLLTTRGTVMSFGRNGSGQLGKLISILECLSRINT